MFPDNPGMTSHPPLSLPEHSPSWHAELHLGFASHGERTALRENRHCGPLRVQKALYPEGAGVCQAILLHPPSGVAGGDHLAISATVEAGAHAQLTTPGAGKWYRSGGAEASQTINFSLAEGATLEWLPQETIFFDGARARLETRVLLAADSRFIGWDILCLGRAAAGELFENGRFDLFFRVTATIPRYGSSAADSTATIRCWLVRPVGPAPRCADRCFAPFPNCPGRQQACSKRCAPSRQATTLHMALQPCPACLSRATWATIAKLLDCGSLHYGKSCDRHVAVDRQFCPESGIPEESSWN